MMKEKICLTLENKINQYLDDELNESQRAEFIQHLKDCPQCRMIFESYQFINSALQETPQIEVPLKLKFKVLETIKKNKLKRLRIINVRLGVAAFLTAALLITIGLQYALPSWPGSMFSSNEPSDKQELALTISSKGITPTTLEVANLDSTSQELEELFKNTPSLIIESKETREKELIYYIIVSEKEMDAFIKDLALFKDKTVVADALRSKTGNIDSGTIYIYIKEEIK